MGDDAARPARRLRAPARRIVRRLADVTCPPQGRRQDLTSAVVAEFEALVDVLPAWLWWSVRCGLAVLNQGARLYPPARGHRFVALADAPADAYFRAVLTIRRGGLGPALQRIKGLVAFCYYELPEVKDQLGYRPDPYIAAVSRHRLQAYGAQIRTGEMAVFAVGPDAADASELPRSDTSPP